MRKIKGSALAVLLVLAMLSGGIVTAEAPAQEPPKIVVYINNGAGTGPGSEAGSTEEAYEMVQSYILEQTGVLCEGILAPREGSDEKLALMLAGGEQIDMWWGVWQKYSSRGIIQPLNDMLEAEGQAIIDAWEPWKAWAGTTDKNGQIWGIPRSTPTTPYQVFIRNDWLEELGLEQPATFEELEALLYTFKEEDLFGNNATVPLGANSLTELENGLVGGFIDGGAGMYYLDDEGNVLPLQLAPGYEDFVAKLAQWYKDGILHKECFSWDATALRQQIARGAVGAAIAWYSSITGQSGTLKENVPGATYGINEAGIIGNNGQLIQTSTNPSQNGMVLSSKCEDPYAAIRVVNWSYESWDNYQVGAGGMEGVHWKYDDLPDARENKTIVAVNEGAPAEYFQNFCFAIGLPMETQQILFDPRDGTPNMHNLWLREHLDDFEATKEPLDFGIFFDIDELNKAIPNRGDIERMVQEETLKFIMGQRPLEDFPKLRDELQSAGLDAWSAEYTRQYNELKGL